MSAARVEGARIEESKKRERRESKKRRKYSSGVVVVISNHVVILETASSGEWDAPPALAEYTTLIHTAGTSTRLLVFEHSRQSDINLL